MVAGPLRNISILYKNSRYIAEEVFQSILCSPESRLTVYNRGDFFRDDMKLRAPGTKPFRITVGSSTVDISMQQWAINTSVPDEDRRDALFTNSPPLQPDIDALILLTDRLLLKKEKLVSDAVVGATTVWAGETGGEDCNSLWAAGDNNTFIEDVHAAIDSMIRETGFRPNRMIFSFNTWNQLQQESSVLNRIRSTTTGIVTEELIKEIFKLDKVFVATSIVNTATEGTTDAMTGQYLFDQSGTGSAFLYYYGPKGLKKPNAGYICTLINTGVNRVSYKFRDEECLTDVYTIKEDFAVATNFAPYLGKLFMNTINT